MKLSIVPDASSSISGFGKNVRRVVWEKHNLTLAFVADVDPNTKGQQPDEENAELKDELWVHFPRPLSKKKAKAVLDALDLRK